MFEGIKRGFSTHLGDNGERITAWRRAIRSSMSKRQSKRAAVAIAEGTVEKVDFIRRYNNYSKWAMACLACVCIELYVVALVASVKAAATIVLILAVSCMVYANCAFRLWVARHVLRNWGRADAKRTFIISEFFIAVQDDFMEALPVRHTYRR